MNKPAQLTEPSAAARFTTAEFVRMIECGAFEDMKLELIDGALERMMAPMNEHARRQTAIVVELANAAGIALVRGDVGVDLGDDTVLVCDAALLLAPIEGHRLLTAGEVRLVVEVAETTLTRDAGLKRLRYAAAGIPHYWIVDPATATVRVFGSPTGGDYAQDDSIIFGTAFPIPGTTATITID